MSDSDDDVVILSESSSRPKRSVQKKSYREHTDSEIHDMFNREQMCDDSDDSSADSGYESSSNVMPGESPSYATVLTDWGYCSPAFIAFNEMSVSHVPPREVIVLSDDDNDDLCREGGDVLRVLLLRPLRRECTFVLRSLCCSTCC